MSGAGNLFAVIDNRDKKITSEFVQKNHQILSQNLGGNKINTEGIMLLEDGFEINDINDINNINNINNDNTYDFECKFFNPDGSTGMMCGNGGRCIIQFAKDKMFSEIDKFDFTFFMANNVYNGKLIENNYVELVLPKHNLIEQCELEIDSKNYKFTYVHNGSDHSVFNLSHLSAQEFWDFDLINFAAKFRYHSSFPNGTNVNIYCIVKDKILLRTFERGVEAETGACGTGSVATAISTNINHKMQFPINIIPTSKSPLIIGISGLENGNFDIVSNYKLTGSADYLEEIILEF